jgi:membrane protease YdiL (CAAX protease family)
MPAPRQLRLPAALVLWLALTSTAAFYANWLGYGGRALFAALVAFALLLAGEILPAAAGVISGAQRILVPPIAWLLAIPILGAFAIYAIGTGSSNLWRWAIVLAYVLFPLALLSLRQGATPGWNDYMALIAIALPVKLRWISALWPYPENQIAHTMAILLGMNVAVAGFLFLRRLDGAGYSLSWSVNQGYALATGFIIVAAIDIPAGLALHFLHWAPGHAGWKSLPLAALGIFFFTAWPEEFVFRGLLQNMLSRSMKNENAGWGVASVLFGLSHVANGFFPNWKYALLATIAGLCYGWVWRKTGTIFGSALLHAAVDTIWHALFA